MGKQYWTYAFLILNVLYDKEHVCLYCEASEVATQLKLSKLRRALSLRPLVPSDTMSLT